MRCSRQDLDDFSIAQLCLRFQIAERDLHAALAATVGNHHRQFWVEMRAMQPVMNLVVQLLFGISRVQWIKAGFADKPVGDDVDPAIDEITDSAVADFFGANAFNFVTYG